jgi:hypothetical protein
MKPNLFTKTRDEQQEALRSSRRERLTTCTLLYVLINLQLDTPDLSVVSSGESDCRGGRNELKNAHGRGSNGGGQKKEGQTPNRKEKEKMADG